MTYRECLRVASLYLNEKNLYDYLNEDTTYTDEEMQRKIKYLCSCVDVIANEIACEYFPLNKTEIVFASNKRIPYENFTYYVVDLKYVKRNGRKVNFDIYSEYIEVDEDGQYEVCYDYSPKSYNGNLDEVIGFYGKITARVVGIGTVAEYCLAFDRFDEAITYDKMFKDALVGIAKNSGKHRVKKRRWA
ncbi:MAG: hypothetical protein E7353_07960 [Clostridiales bacterium]|nr:hypothetical protein [Clostridiales bacterium]